MAARKAWDAEWVTTKEAAKQLSCCGHTLKRKRDINGGFLEAGRHWICGPTYKSALLWNVVEIRMAFHAKGMEERYQRPRSNEVKIDSHRQKAERQKKPKNVATSAWKNRYRRAVKLKPDTALHLDKFQEKFGLNTNEALNLIIAAYFKKPPR